MSSGVTVYEAAPEDKARTTFVETAKISTGIGVGVLTGYLIIGLATGGTGLIVIGIVAASAALASKGTSELTGYVVGEAYDYIDGVRNK
ncbi:hypothetical protein F895_02401 [Acinetobacter sp. CIP 64.2]|uniref:hypothetical protein n=1 Tax=unclassified Acinetobacter TaxID=196816 RepID=UPI000288C192|nr:MULTISPECIES: hypothetical protein [unclassified Acinetobacter]ENX14446.1 hypothetical protein F895_02401 [Acinetobacter sp. CIP 64.2]